MIKKLVDHIKWYRDRDRGFKVDHDKLLDIVHELVQKVNEIIDEVDPPLTDRYGKPMSAYDLNDVARIRRRNTDRIADIRERR